MCQRNVDRTEYFQDTNCLHGDTGNPHLKAKQVNMELDKITPLI